MDLGLLIGNLERIRRHLAGRSRIMAVVKANAYGHGIVPVARALESAGIGDFAVAFPDEGVALRDGGIRASILVMGGFMPQDVPELARLRLSPIVYHSDHLAWLSSLGDGMTEPLPVHIKIDTGMGRLGLDPGEVAGFAGRLADIKGVSLEGLMSHFADEDLRQSPGSGLQIERFRSAIEGLKAAGLPVPPQIHMANTGAILSRSDAWFSMVRPGLGLYGYPPSRSLAEILPLAPVMTLKCRLSHVRKVPAGTPISYGGTFVTRRESVIGVVPMGYADGYPRTLSNRGSVLVRGVRAPILGRVCMDMFVVDLTGAPGARVTDEAVLLGAQGDESITAADLAEQAGTISYEILSTLGARIPRIYLEGGVPQ